MLSPDLRDDAQSPHRLETHSDADAREPSLFEHARTPTWLRYGVPLVLAFNFALFVWANVAMGATVNLTLETPTGEVIEPDPLFEFTFANTVRDMWLAEEYVLSIMCAVFSGGWPYVKITLLGLAWFLPPQHGMWPRLRRTVLIVLDALGKWSLVDAYVLLLCMVAFRVHFELTFTGDRGEDLVSTCDIFTKPQIGSYLFIGATIISLVMGHVVLGADRNATRTLHLEPPDPTWDEQSPKESIASHMFCHPEGGGRRLRFSSRGKVAVAALMIAATALVIAGVLVEGYEFDIQGLTGLFLGDDAMTKYSVVSTGEDIPHASGNSDDVKVMLLQIGFFVFVLGSLLALATLMLFLWLVPLAARHQARAFVVAEILFAWSALDVFVMIVLVSVFTFRSFTAFIIGDSCDEINEIIEENSDVVPGDDVCFDVVPGLEPEFWCLFFASIIYSAVFWPVLRICRAAVDDRIEREGVPVGDGLGVALLNGVKQGETPPFDASIAKALLELQLIEGSAAAGEAPSSGLDLSVSSVGMGLA
uniref:Transmembrane protein n=1 Tax=Phaeomonas parva TaxID=124430 RepID=A0A7S1TQI1_9STRA|mmetsp:Transcript_11910/g.36097  ORF Transcript_11910/g.36097 Transcript_11910/m.36097 type:complete len:533 (+) Transcript_11910:208-1806(+)